MKTFHKSALLIALMAASSGCHSHGPMVKRNSELNCPTDIRQTVPWCAGEDAVFRCPCGPSSEFYGYKPTCWGIWPAPAEQWRDSHCGPLVREESYGSPDSPVLEMPAQPIFAPPLKSEYNSGAGRDEYPLPEPDNGPQPKAPRPRDASRNEAAIEDQSDASDRQPIKRDLQRSQEAARKFGAAMRRYTKPDDRIIPHNELVSTRNPSHSSNTGIVTTATDFSGESGSVLQVSYHESTETLPMCHYQKRMILSKRNGYQR